MQKNTLLITAGGTGGHIYPALAVAKKWQEQGGHVEWLGTEHGLEASIVPKHNIQLNFIPVQAIRGKNIFRKLLSPLMLLIAIIQAIFILLKIKPKVVLGMGGYASGPGSIAAWLLRIPLVIHEQNSILGKTNRILLPFAKTILEAFPNTITDQHTQKKVIHCGNPLRKELSLLIPKQRSKNSQKSALNILIVGGSRGALKLNTLLPKIFADKRFEEVNLHIKHQAGEKNFQAAQSAYEADILHAKNNKAVEVLAYIDDMKQAYEWADIIIARAGAMTVFEVMAAARPCVFIPYPYAVDDHQTYNAKYLVDQSAGYIVQESELSVESLLPIIQNLYTDFEHYNLMSSKIYSLRMLDADEQIASSCRSAVK